MPSPSSFPPTINYNAPRSSYSGGTPGSATYPGVGHPSDERFSAGGSSCAASEDGAPFVARRAMNLHGCALPHFAPPPAATPLEPLLAGAFRDRSSVPERLPLHQHELDPRLGLLLAAEGEEPLALQVEQLLFGPFRSRGDVPARKYGGDLPPDLLVVIADLPRRLHRVKPVRERREGGPAGEGDATPLGHLVPFPVHREHGVLRVLDQEVALEGDPVRGPQEAELAGLLRRGGDFRHPDRFECLAQKRQRVRRDPFRDPLEVADRHLLQASACRQKPYAHLDQSHVRLRRRTDPVGR